MTSVKNCFAAVLEDVGKFKYRKFELRDLQSDEVLVNVKASGVCGSDVPRVYEKGMYKKNLVPGHEFSGMISEAHDADLIGKRVAVFPLIPCRKCEYCEKGEMNLCEDYNYLGSRTHGGFSEYAIVPKNNIVFLPDNLSFEEASLLEPVAVAYHAIKKIPNLKGKCVLVIGLGTIGMLAGQWVKTFGAKRLTGVDRNNFKMEIANKLSFDHTYHTDKLPENFFDVIVECSGDTELINRYFSCLKKKGHVLLIANFEKGLKLNSKSVSSILRGEVTLLGSWNSSIHDAPKSEWDSCLYHMKKKNINVKPMITHTFPLSEIEEVFMNIRGRNLRPVKCIMKVGDE